MAEATTKGFDVDDENFAHQLEHTWKHLERGKDGYAKGEGQGGGVDTAGYALWALDVGEHPSDEVTSAVIEYLLRKQQDNGRWKCSSNRPPSEVSDFTTTYLALYGLQNFAGEAESERVLNAHENALEWLLKTEIEDTEDQVFRALALSYFADTNVDAESALKSQIESILGQQRDDGGWAQKDDMDSDAYATGQVLDTLFRVGGVDSTDDSYLSGVKFLMESQLEDGSWIVVSRSKPFQTYYETGFPHEKNQFISTAASCWATMALLNTISDAVPRTDDD